MIPRKIVTRDVLHGLSWLKLIIRNHRWMKMLGHSSPKDVASAVPRSPELVRALDDGAALEAKQKRLHAEIAELSKGRMNLLATTIDATAIDKRLGAIGVELRDLENLKQAAAGNIRQHKGKYAAEVRAALLSRRQQAAGRVVAAIDALKDATADLNRTTAAIQSAGGHARQLPAFPLIDGIQTIAQTIEREA